MLVKTLNLNNYRNYSSGSFNFDPHLNIIIGPNGIGKTNILESLIVVSNTKSFRTLNDQDLIKKTCEYSRIECLSDDDTYKVVINQNGKTLYVNNNPIKKTSEFIGKINCILFKPADLELFNQSPKERRRLLDLEIGKVSKNYLHAILTYTTLLKDKNKLLKENKIDDVYLNLLEEQMILPIQTIITEREDFIKIINSYINNFYYQISGIKADIKIEYKKCADINHIKEEINKSRDKDMYYHYTTFGPHHEDYVFMMNGYELNSIASQGQTRMVLIAFKLSLVEYIKQKIKKTPILLLDDILSELDINNRERLLNIIPKDTQVIITGTDLNGININSKYNLIKLKEGKDGRNEN